MEDTVEKNVAGLAETIVAQDEEARAQELVRSSFTLSGSAADYRAGSYKHSP